MGNHMRHLLAIALAIALAGCGASAQEVNHTKGLEACTVELNGDSVLFGFVDNKTTWRLGTTPADWLGKYGYKVADKTAGGLRTYDLLRGYATPFPEAWADLFPSGPQQGYGAEDHPSNIVVIQTGINDFRTEPFHVAQVAHDYRVLVDYIRMQGKIPVITGITKLDQNRVDPEIYARVAAIRTAVRGVAIERNVHYASFDAVEVAWTDGIHLDQASSNGVTENLRYVLGVICGTN